MPRTIVILFFSLLTGTLLFNKGYAQTNGITKDFLLGKFDYTRDTSFIRVNWLYTQRSNVYLKKETYQAFLKMHEAAANAGIDLTIISGTRSFYDQHYKWDSEWNAPKFYGVKNGVEKVRKLLRWWSMPGTSRHHWGTDIDMTDMSVAFYQTKRGRKMYDWMTKNAARYGFYQPFNANRKNGYQEEKWHWSYLPLSKIYLNEYAKRITYSDLSGFAGAIDAKQLDVINTRVLAVNPKCK